MPTRAHVLLVCTLGSFFHFPIHPDDDDLLWQRATETADQDEYAPSWLPREMNIYIKYRTAMCMRLLVGDVFGLSKIELLGQTMVFDAHVIGCRSEHGLAWRVS